MALWTFSVSSNHSAVSLGLLIAGLVAAVIGERFEIPRVPLGIMTLAILLLVFFSGIEAPMGHRFFEPGMGPAYRGGVVAAALLVVLLVRKCPGGQVFFRVAAALGLMLSAGVVREVLPFAYYVALETALLLLFLRLHSSERSRLLTLGSAAAALLVALLASALAASLHWSERQLGDIISLMQGSSGSAVFSARSDFSWARGRQTSTKVVARAFAEEQPLYMVGMRYLTYEGERWSVARGKSLVPELGEGVFGRLRSEREIRVELTSLPAVTLLHPAATTSVRVNVKALKEDRLGTLYLTPQSGFLGSYHLGLGPQLPQSDPELLELCLALPPDCPQVVKDLADQLVRSAPSEAVAVRAVEDYLRQNFTYGFGHPFPTDRDAIEVFLEEKPPAHCEVFATSMALILRAGGIPCRYINGFLMAEKSRLGDYWVSRDRDAHAWVEAYVQGQGWVTADPTPPSALSSPPVPLWREGVEWFVGLFQRTLAALRGGAIPLPVLVAAGLLLLAWRLKWRPRWVWNSAKTEAAPRQKRLRRMQQILGKCEALREQARPKHLTVLEWGQTLEQDFNRFLERYSELRYSSSEPSESDLDELEQLCSRLKVRD